MGHDKAEVGYKLPMSFTSVRPLRVGREGNAATWKGTSGNRRRLCGGRLFPTGQESEKFVLHIISFLPVQPDKIHIERVSGIRRTLFVWPYDRMKDGTYKTRRSFRLARILRVSKLFARA